MSRMWWSVTDGEKSVPECKDIIQRTLTCNAVREKDGAGLMLDDGAHGTANVKRVITVYSHDLDAVGLRSQPTRYPHAQNIGKQGLAPVTSWKRRKLLAESALDSYKPTVIALQQVDHVNGCGHWREMLEARGYRVRAVEGIGALCPKGAHPKKHEPDEIYSKLVAWKKEVLELLAYQTVFLDNVPLTQPHLVRPVTNATAQLLFFRIRETGESCLPDNANGESESEEKEKEEEDNSGSKSRKRKARRGPCDYSDHSDYSDYESEEDDSNRAEAEDDKSDRMMGPCDVNFFEEFAKRKLPTKERASFCLVNMRLPATNEPGAEYLRVRQFHGLLKSVVQFTMAKGRLFNNLTCAPGIIFCGGIGLGGIAREIVLNSSQQQHETMAKTIGVTPEALAKHPEISGIQAEIEKSYKEAKDNSRHKIESAWSEGQSARDYAGRLLWAASVLQPQSCYLWHPSAAKLTEIFRKRNLDARPGALLRDDAIRADSRFSSSGGDLTQPLQVPEVSAIAGMAPKHQHKDVVTYFDGKVFSLCDYVLLARCPGKGKRVALATKALLTVPVSRDPIPNMAIGSNHIALCAEVEVIVQVEA